MTTSRTTTAAIPAVSTLLKPLAKKAVAAAVALGLSAGIAPLASAADFSVKIVNLTGGFWYTPFLVAAHDSNTRLFTAGETASANIQAMAEGGDISGLVTDLTALNATIQANPAGGPLGPGMSTTTDLNTDNTQNTNLSVVAMLLPTNDAFMGLNGITIPTAPGIYSWDVVAYDAGTEANNELLVPGAGGAPGVLGIPADPGGNSGTGGTGVPTTEIDKVHIHRNALGDMDATGGRSDLNAGIHRWLNPVARVIVTVR